MTGRKLAHHYADEIRPIRQAVPYHESQRRVAVETLTDFVAGLAVIFGAIVVVLMAGAMLRFAVAHPVVSSAYVVIVGAFVWGLARTAARADRR